MRKTILLVILICLALISSACGATSQETKNTEYAFTPDISIDQIEWSIDAGTIKGENHVLGKVINNSQFVITSFKMTFTEKQEISKEDKASFYADIQKSQGFDDAWMTEYIESREKLSQPISMYFKIDDGIDIGAEKEQVNVQIKYEGYINKQMIQIEQFKKLENQKLDPDTDYSTIDGLSLEARQKLNQNKPDSIGQASRISGVSPADISVLLVYQKLKRGK